MVERQVSEQNYFVATPQQRKKSHLCHINLLKLYYSRAAPVISVSECHCSNVSPALIVNSVSSGVVSSALGPDAEVDVSAPDDPVVSGRLKNSETQRNLGSLISHLTESQCSELAEHCKK